MKKYSFLLTIAAALLAVSSCRQSNELDGPSYNDNDGVFNATFAIRLGQQTKSFADGTTVDKIYAGIYEITASGKYTWVADNSADPSTIANGSATVSFEDIILLGKSYKVVFWAQKEGAPYYIDWAKNNTSGPTVTMTATGSANDESRDAFFGMYETGTVNGDIDLTGSPITIKRPFAQVNVLVPTDNFVDASGPVTSSMTVAQAPTVLNLATKETSDPADWTFSSAAINEAAFGTYASTHKYVAMNYVLVDQSAAGNIYDVTFSVTSSASMPQVAIDRQMKNLPLKANGRTNIVGDIFDENFNLLIPIMISPDFRSEQVATTVTVAVGQSANEAFKLTSGVTSSIAVAVSHPIEVESDKPQITIEPEGFAETEWNLATGKLDVTPLVNNGSAVITLVFPAVTKTTYASAIVQIYVTVGNNSGS